MSPNKLLEQVDRLNKRAQAKLYFSKEGIHGKVEMRLSFSVVQFVVAFEEPLKSIFRSSLTLG